jgi:hypothetical protein
MLKKAFLINHDSVVEKENSYKKYKGILHPSKFGRACGPVG